MSVVAISRLEMVSNRVTWGRGAGHTLSGSSISNYRPSLAMFQLWWPPWLETSFFSIDMRRGSREPCPFPA
jgi:hypothetical protein